MRFHTLGSTIFGFVVSRCSKQKGMVHGLGVFWEVLKGENMHIAYHIYGPEPTFDLFKE